MTSAQTRAWPAGPGVEPTQAEQEVFTELARQFEKWGRQDHDAPYWLGILVEEVGEAAKAMIEGDTEGWREELIHVAAVAQNAAECYDRNGGGQ